MPTLARADVELHYEIRGSGRPLLLIAGLAADSAFWLAAIDALAASRQVILVDNRGSGRTTPLDAPTGIGVMADDCAALLRHLGLRGVDMAGHSMGGMIAQECAIRYPELVDRVVLASTAPVAQRPQQRSVRELGRAVRDSRPSVVVSQPLLLGAVGALFRQRAIRRGAGAARRELSVPANAAGAAQPGGRHRPLRPRGRAVVAARAHAGARRHRRPAVSDRRRAPRSRRRSRMPRSWRWKAPRIRSRWNRRRTSPATCWPSLRSRRRRQRRQVPARPHGERVVARPRVRKTQRAHQRDHRAVVGAEHEVGKVDVPAARGRGGS